MTEAVKKRTKFELNFARMGYDGMKYLPPVSIRK